MAFPVSPVNGQTSTLNGITYVYNSTTLSWTRVATVNSYTSSTAPSNPKVGDIWYDTATDDIYRYTTDGTSSYWLDITGPTVASSITYQNTNVYANSFSGTSQYLSTPSNAAFSFGTGDFTIEGWINLSSATGAYRVILHLPHSSGQIFVRFGNSAAYSSYFQVSMLGTLVSNVYSTNQTQTALLNQWVHFAFTRGSSTCRVFLNGVLQNLGTGGPATSFVSNTFSDSTNITNTAAVTIGEEVGGTIPFIGHISNLRIIKGTALYTSNFTVPTAPLTAITNTSLLTCQTIPPVDASTNNLAVTNVGNVGLSIYSSQQTPSSAQPTTLLYRLNSDLVGANVNTAQSVLGVGVTLASNTVYQFEAVYMAYKSAGTNPHSVGFGFGGTATLNNISYVELSNNQAGAAATVATQSSVSNGWVNSASNTTLIPSSATAAVNWFVFIRGTVSVNAGGTFIPQYTLSAAPGAAYTTAAGSYITLTPISSIQGTWA